jgi:chromosome segregation ATPase
MTLLPRSPKKLTTLNEEREQLLSKLKDVEASIRLEENNLARIPTTLSEQKKKMSQLKSDLQSIKAKKKNPVPRTVEEDNQQIADVDSMHLKALDMVKSVLDM